LAPLASLSLAGQEHGRTIPLAEVRARQIAAMLCDLISLQVRFAVVRWISTSAR
jgi:hypothetical protein